MVATLVFSTALLVRVCGSLAFFRGIQSKSYGTDT